MIFIPRDLAARADSLTPQPDYRFSSDGCSGGMSWLWSTVTGKPPPWEGCCVSHDFAYWAGGTRAQRRSADARLRRCVLVRAQEYALIGQWLVTVLAWAMWADVRVGGHPFAAPAAMGFLFTPAVFSGHYFIAAGVLCFALRSLNYRWAYGWRWPHGYDREG